MCVQLAPWHVQVAVDAGHKRYNYNLGVARDTHEYAVGKEKGLLEPDLQNSVASCLCEYATSLHYNQCWNNPYCRHEYVADASVVPDVGFDIEVKRVRLLHNMLTVLESDVKHNYLMVRAYLCDTWLASVMSRFLAGLDPSPTREFPVWLLGQVRANVAWAEGTRPNDWRDKKKCPLEVMEAVPGVNTYDPEPPENVRRTYAPETCT